MSKFFKEEDFARVLLELSDEEVYMGVSMDVAQKVILKWKSLKVKHMLTSNFVKIFPGPNGSAKQITKKIDAFDHFITSSIIDEIVKFTNI